MSDQDKVTTYIQGALSFLVVLGVLVIVIIYELGFAAKMSDAQDKTFGTQLTILSGAVAAIIFFWFQRQRVPAVALPAPVTDLRANVVRNQGVEQ